MRPPRHRVRRVPSKLGSPRPRDDQQTAADLLALADKVRPTDPDFADRLTAAAGDLHNPEATTP